MMIQSISKTNGHLNSHNYSRCMHMHGTEASKLLGETSNQQLIKYTNIY